MAPARCPGGQKILIAVQGATLEEFAAKYRADHPGADLLVWPAKKSVTAAEGREFFSRAATGDWDAVIVTYDALDLLAAGRRGDAERAALAAMQEAVEGHERLSPVSRPAGEDGGEQGHAGPEDHHVRRAIVHHSFWSAWSWPGS